MSGLAILLRLANRRAEELRIHLASATAARQAAEAALQAQQASMQAEAAQAGADAVGLADWGAWIRAARRQQGRLAAAAADQQAQEEAVREQMREGIAESKRLELALAATEQASRLKAQRRSEAAAEDAELRRPKPAETLTA